MAALGAYLVQDMTGWLDMAVTSVFWCILGLAVNLAHQKTRGPVAAWTRIAIVAFSGLMMLLSLYLLNDKYTRIVADAQLFKAQKLDVSTRWPDTEALVNKALLSLPVDSRTEMAAAQIYAMRFALSHDARAYARSRELLESSYAHNRFDRLRLYNIVALESTALERGNISKASSFAQEAIAMLARTDDDNPGFHQIRAWFLAVQGRFVEALAAIRVARRLMPEDEGLRSSELEYEAKLK